MSRHKESPLEGNQEGQKKVYESNDLPITSLYQFINIPAGLKDRNQWVCWKKEKRNGKTSKKPIDPKTGRPAAHNDPYSWGTFDQACHFYETKKDNRISGIGFVFTQEDDYCGIDLDKCRDPKTGIIKPWVQGVMENFQSYTEISPSGTGVHIISKCKLPDGGRKNSQTGIEVYDRVRYFTVTGNVLDGFDTIHERQAELEALLKKYFDSGLAKDAVQAPPTPRLKTLNKLSDQELIQKATRAKNGEKFKRLWSGDLSDHNGDHSGGDMSLCKFLAYWTNNDPAKIDRLFRKSKLFRSKKWDEVHSADGKTYGEMTVQKAIIWNKRDNGLKYFSARDLINTDFPEPRWTITGLLPEGLTILAGKPKHGKSLFALNIGIAVANGTKALNRFGTEKGTVIYFALEDTYRRLKKRLSKMLSPGVLPPEKLILSNSLQTLDKGGIETIHEYLEKFPDTVLVIIDTLALFRSQNKKSSNIYDADYHEISPIKSIADEKGIAILIIHHMRKAEADDIMDTFSGTLGLTGAADTLMALKRNLGTDDATLEVSGRDLESKRYAIRLQSDSLSWECIGSGNDLKNSKQQQKLFDALKSNSSKENPISPKELEKITEFNGQYIRNTIPKLIEQGSIGKVDRGKYYYIEDIQNNNYINDNEYKGDNEDN